MSDHEAAQSQADEASQSQADSTDATTAQVANTIDALPDWAQKELRSARREAADFRTRLQKIEDRDKSELQKAQERAAELEKQYGETVTALQRERAEKQIRDAAASAGARPDRLAGIYRLIRDDVQYGDDGRPTNVKELIEAAQNDAPEFFQRVAGSGDGGKGNGDTGSDPNAALNRYIRQEAGHAG